MADKTLDPLSVGRIRELIKDLPDDAPAFPHWANGPPGDADPAVVVAGFEVRRDHANSGWPGLCILVDLEYLNEDEDEDEDEDEEEDDDDDGSVP